MSNVLKMKLSTLNSHISEQACFLNCATGDRFNWDQFIDVYHLKFSIKNELIHLATKHWYDNHQQTSTSYLTLLGDVARNRSVFLEMKKTFIATNYTTNSLFALYQMMLISIERALRFTNTATLHFTAKALTCTLVTLSHEQFFYDW